MTLDRQALTDALTAALAPLPEALAAWEGGSTAFDRTDAWSDLDVMAIASDEGVDAVFTAAEAALEALSPIARRYAMPAPTWHGHAQRFYQLQDASPYLMIDLVVMAEGAPNHFLEPERHGTPRVLFDKAGLVVQRPGDPAARDARLRARAADLGAWFAMSQSIVHKELARDRALDALTFYQGLTLRPLVELLRIIHCPWRHDFGWRYLDRDLPPEVHARLEALAFVAGLEELRAKHAQAAAWFRELHAGYLGS